MSSGSIASIVILAFAIVLLVVETIAEVGVISLSRSRARLLLSRDPSYRRAQRLERITATREQALGSYAVGRTLALVTGLAAAFYLVTAEAGFSWDAVLVTAVGGMLVVAVIQAVPRRLAQMAPEDFGLTFAPIMDALDSLFLIPALIVESPARLVARFLHENDAHAPEPTEIEVLLEQGDEELEESEREMIRRVMEIGDTAVHEAMVPRPDIIAVDVNAALANSAQVAVDHGYSRVPVYDGDIDNIIGILYAKDVLANLLTEQPTTVRELMRPPLLVPESKLISDLLAEFRSVRVHIAIVLDEYGGTAGLVTIEDLLEEIVGDIRDEYDRYTVSAVVRVSEEEAIMDGRASVDHLEELFNVHPTSEEFDTVGGLVFDALGKIPEVGDEICVDGLTIAVLRMDGRRIARVRVRRFAGNSASPSPAPRSAP